MKNTPSGWQIFWATLDMVIYIWAIFVLLFGIDGPVTGKLIFWAFVGLSAQGRLLERNLTGHN